MELLITFRGGMFESWSWRRGSRITVSCSHSITDHTVASSPVAQLRCLDYKTQYYSINSINWLTVFFLVNLKMGRSCWPQVGGTVKYYSREQFPNVKPPQFKNDIKIDLIIFPFELYLVSLQC